MSEIDHSELPDFLTAETLAQICAELALLKRHEVEHKNTERVKRIEKLSTYYWESLRSKKDRDQALVLINEAKPRYVWFSDK